MRSNLYDAIQSKIEGTALSEAEKNDVYKILLRMKEQKLGVLITGATGCGKSSTINALFDTEVAKVGTGADPETQSVEKYEMDQMTLWDSPGLGDSPEADKRHARNIIRKLAETDAEGNAVVDVVLVILDGSSRNMGTDFRLINEVIIPNLGKDREKRLLVAINQADMAMKGRYWDYEANRPEPELVEFLEEKVRSVKERIYESTGIQVEPVYYSAGYKEAGGERVMPYNLSKLLCYLIKTAPVEKRIPIAAHASTEDEVFVYGEKDYTEETSGYLLESILEGARIGGEIGAGIGRMIAGETGAMVGRTIGIVAGGLVKFVGGIFGF